MNRITENFPSAADLDCGGTGGSVMDTMAVLWLLMLMVVCGGCVDVLMFIPVGGRGGTVSGNQTITGTRVEYIVECV